MHVITLKVDFFSFVHVHYTYTDMANRYSKPHTLTWPDEFHLKLLILAQHLNLTISTTIIFLTNNYVEKLGPIEDKLPTRKIREVARNITKQELGIKEDNNRQQGPPREPQRPKTGSGAAVRGRKVAPRAGTAPIGRQKPDGRAFGDPRKAGLAIDRLITSHKRKKSRTTL